MCQGPGVMRLYLERRSLGMVWVSRQQKMVAMKTSRDEDRDEPMKSPLGHCARRGRSRILSLNSKIDGC